MPKKVKVYLEEELPKASTLHWDCSGQGLAYVAGYIAKKFSVKYEFLGSRTNTVPYFDTRASVMPWIFRISRGGLVAPSIEFFKACKEFEEAFQNFHGKNIDSEPDVMNRLLHIFESKFSWPTEVMLLFIKARTFIRIKALNQKLKLQEAKEKMRRLSKVSQYDG
jgi:hypothetical protein